MEALVYCDYTSSYNITSEGRSLTDKQSLLTKHAHILLDIGPTEHYSVLQRRRSNVTAFRALFLECHKLLSLRGAPNCHGRHTRALKIDS